jgi:hypothetical protein
MCVLRQAFVEVSCDVLLLRTTSRNGYHVLCPSVLSAVYYVTLAESRSWHLGMKSSATWSLLGYDHACCDVCGFTISLTRVLCALFSHTDSFRRMSPRC